MRQNGKDVDWSALWLYRATACGQRKHRPVNTGDVFFQAPVFDLGEAVEKDVMVLQHPCAMRSNGVELLDRILVVEVSAHVDMCAPGDWMGNYNLMPLPRIHGNKPEKDKHYAAFFERLYVTTPEALDRTRRHGAMSLEGICLLMQRWSHHNTRVVVPAKYFRDDVRAQFVETTGVEEWCATRMALGVDEKVAAAEANKWLGQLGELGIPYRKLLENPDFHRGVIQAMRAAAESARVPPPPDL